MSQFPILKDFLENKKSLVKQLVICRIYLFGQFADGFIIGKVRFILSVSLLRLNLRCLLRLVSVDNFSHDRMTHHVIC